MANLTGRARARYVQGMFARIAGRYDLLNHLLSANQDRRWRRRAVGELPAGEASRVLDLCGGTGDLTLELARVEALFRRQLAGQAVSWQTWVVFLSGQA